MVVSGVLWGMVIFAEHPSPLMWTSAVLLLASLNLIGKNNAKEDRTYVEET
jgi:drug/metabolite transporter (DMT)-like permease